MASAVSISINEAAVRKTVTPMVNDYIASLRQIAFKKGQERHAFQNHYEARFRNRLDAFAGENGIFGQQRATLNVIVDTILNERATVALNAIGQEMSPPQHGHRMWGGWMTAVLVFLTVF